MNNAARILLLPFLFSSAIFAQNISTIAGGGPRSLPALQVGLAQPSGTAVDAAGNIYISLSQIHQIWRINSAAQVTVFAGNGSFLYDGDGGQAVSSTLNQPKGLAFDAAGDLFVADSSHNRVRKISPAGVITTVAGNGTAGFSGDSGVGTAAQLNNPVAVAVDSANNVYIADKNNQRIRMVTSAGVISTLAGNGTAAFSGDGGPAASASLNGAVGVAVDSAGAVYIADQLNFRVRKVVAGNISTVAGIGTFGYSGDGGPAASAQLNTVVGVCVDQYKNLYIVEAYDIRAIPGGSANIQTFAGGGSAGYSGDGGIPAAAKFQNMVAMALDNAGTTVYIVDAGNSRIRKIAANVTTTLAGNGTTNLNGDGQLAANANFLTPNFVTADNAGTLVFSDSASTAIRKLTLASGVVNTVAGNGYLGLTADGGAVSGPLYNPSAFTFDAAGNIIFLEQNRIRKVSGGVYSTIGNTANTAGFSGDGGPAALAQFQYPAALARAANGDLYVADSQNHRVRLLSGSTGIVSTVAGTGTASSTGDGGLGVNATLNYPSSLSLDGLGDLFIGELSGNRVRKLVLSTGMISTAAGDGTTNFADGVTATATGLSAPTSVFSDQSGNLFIADQGHSRVRKVTVGTGMISTVAGNGTYDFSGDGGPAVSAAVNPLGIMVDRSQNLYIADSSGRLRTTVVSACFFTFSSPTLYVNSAAGTGSITVTATNPSCPYTVANSSPFVTITSGASGVGSGTVTFSYNADIGQNRTAVVTVGGTPVTLAQAGTLGQYNIGFFQSAGVPVWALDSNGNGYFDPGDRVFPFAGQPGAIAFAGDWNGDGRSKVGYYMNGFWVLDYNGNGIYDSGDKVYGFGGPDSSYVPVVGDWNGDGRAKIGIYRNGIWSLDTNGNGAFDPSDSYFAYGGNGAGEVPIVGDWNGDKRTKIGYYFNGVWSLDYNGDGVFNSATDKYYANFPYAAGDKIVMGDWNFDGKTKIGIYRGGFWILDYNGNGAYDGGTIDRFFGFGGAPGDVPITADWNGDGRTKIGIYNNGFWVLDFNGNGQFDGTAGGDRFIGFGGTPGNQPVIGRW